jgi:AraC-like DNA-binding protein
MEPPDAPVRPLRERLRLNQGGTRMMRLAGQMIRYRPGRRMPPHVDGCRRLSVLVAGDQEERHGRSSVQTGFGSVAIKAPEAVHSNVFGPAGTTMVSVQLSDAALCGLGFDANAIVPWRWNDHASADPTGLRLAAAPCRRDAAQIEECVIDLLGRSFSEARPDGARVLEPERVRRLRDRLHDEPGAVPSIRRWAAEEAMHPFSLGRAFRRAFGVSITQYRQRLRVAAVARSLLDGGASLVELAVDHGFADSSHMSRLFRRHIGAPPGSFQASLRPAAGRLESFKTEWIVEI